MATKKRRIKKTAKRTVKRETTDDVSSDASRLLQLVKAGWRFVAVDDSGEQERDVTKMVKAVAGSALVQDTTKGPRKR